ncbi:MAG TPA: ice-binding family protein [Verrucomicrobiae bacterium]|nr:ice-binding family protein [Verrucomicrobiae bacterium]
MKLTTGLLGCALAAGLMTFATNKAQANLVIDNTVYAPFKLKLSTQYMDGNKHKKASITSKDFLKDEGYNNKVQLVVNTDTFDIWVVNKDTLVANLSSDDTLSIFFSDSQTTQPNPKKESYKETGVLEVISDGVNSFDISGAYSDSYSWGKVDKKGNQTYKESLTAKDLSGDGIFSALSADTLPVTGSASYKGSGKMSADQTQGSVNLGAAANFAVLAGSTVANTGFTTVTGDLGLSPGSDVTGFPPGTVTGTQHVADPTAAQAELDLTTAYNDAAGRTVAPVSVAGNIGGMTLAPGLYKSTGSLEISSGDLTLDAQGDANAVFIFQIASTLTTTSGRQVILTGGAKAANIFWQVGTSAVLGSTSVFKGTIMADQSITLETGVSLEGRALARIAAVTLDSDVITLPAS